MLEEKDLPEIVVKVIESFADRFFDSAEAVLSGLSNEVRLRIKSGFKDYLSATINKYSKTKNLIFPDVPRYLYDFYVPIDLLLDKEQIPSPSYDDVERVSSHVVITGTGGSGKSTFMRHLLLQAAAGRKRIPVYVELRDFNSSERVDLVDLVLEKLAAFRVNLPTEYILKAMERGYFVFLLDGFDEVVQAKVAKVQRVILDASDRYDKNVFIVSSRPDERFRAWDRFHNLNAAPLNLEKAVAIIERIPADDDIKRRFLVDLREKLFEQHQSFLSNPLLLTIMLITYRDIAEIPNKLHLFYSQAFASLYNRHDALKPGGFRREMRAGLAQDDFARAFSAFSILSYSDNKIEFSLPEIREYLQGAKKISRLEFDPDALLEDLLQAVCMLVRDGNEYRYAHRSFQEYFAALFVANADPQVREKLVQKVRPRIGREKVFELMFELNREVVEECFVVPVLDGIKEATKYRGRLNKAVHLRFLALLFTGMYYTEEPLGLGLTIKDVQLWEEVMFVRRAYNIRMKGGRLDVPEQVKAVFAGAKMPAHGEEPQLSIRSLRKHPEVLDWFMKQGWWGGETFIRLMQTLEEVKKGLQLRMDSISRMLLKDA